MPGIKDFLQRLVDDDDYRFSLMYNPSEAYQEFSLNKAEIEAIEARDPTALDLDPASLETFRKIICGRSTRASFLEKSRPLPEK